LLLPAILLLLLPLLLLLLPAGPSNKKVKLSGA
jgi:hypothetical protein